ncbi:hypothetical protein OAE26_02080 [Synechococcus sp. AH-551-E05]|nr:hypothetical protein [Synechococcus sp. AH-551-E05]MDB4651343.1 hypothetical protein [Synechococcus sp. AH-551-E05]
MEYLDNPDATAISLGIIYHSFLSIIMRYTSKKPKKTPRKSERTQMPDALKKSKFIYMNGTITKACHGFYHVNLDNEMKVLCTARKLDSHHKLTILDGDTVTCEIDPLSFESNCEKLRGRIVWLT